MNNNNTYCPIKREKILENGKDRYDDKSGKEQAKEML